jgi:hypothetical protein
MPTDRDSQYCRAGYSQAVADAVVTLNQPKRTRKATRDRGSKTRATEEETIWEGGSDSDDISIHDALRSPRHHHPQQLGVQAPKQVQADTGANTGRGPSRRAICLRFLLGMGLGVAACVGVMVMAAAEREGHCVISCMDRKTASDMAGIFVTRARATLTEWAHGVAQALSK